MSLEQETLKIYSIAEKTGGKTTKKVLQQYKITMNNILTEIAKISLEYSVNGELKISQAQRIRVLSQLAKTLRAQCKELADYQESETVKVAEQVLNETYYSTAYTIDKGIEINKSFAMLSKEFIDTAINLEIDGKTFSNRIWDDCALLANRVKSDVQKAMIQGSSTEKLARQIKKDFGCSAYQAKRLINTEVARAVTTAQDEAYKNSGVVSMVMWSATLEDNTCDECASYDGQYFALDDHPALPAHPGCRCALVPVVQGWQPSQRLDNTRPIATKDNPDAKKEVVDYTSVSAWMESKGL
ncbi:minor capsid protein [Oscillospiraceae bacterium 44-34]|jgi:SPP1 gp7 family putative phage head morphogenesis protein|uniref:minor capsid protein n=1 Tax=uncultured Oscillibacter sp. TaxID=876091 RepID=UPI00260B6608|nr:minor capsid protein [uncultured Oscillibacter sp.]